MTQRSSSLYFIPIHACIKAAQERYNQVCPPVFLHHGHIQIPATEEVAQVVLLKQTGQLHSVRAAHSCHFLSTALQKPTQLIAPGRSEILQNHFKFPFIIHLGRRSLIAPSLRTSRLKFEVFELWPKEVILPDDYLHNHKNPSHSALSVFSTQCILHSRTIPAVPRQNPLR